MTCRTYELYDATTDSYIGWSRTSATAHRRAHRYRYRTGHSVLIYSLLSGSGRACGPDTLHAEIGGAR